MDERDYKAMNKDLNKYPTTPFKINSFITIVDFEKFIESHTYIQNNCKGKSSEPYIKRLNNLKKILIQYNSGK